MKIRIGTTLASLTLLAFTVVPAGNAQPLSRLLHMHPRSAALSDGRISLHVCNQSDRFEELMVNGKSYTLPTHQFLSITAPVGTIVYAGVNVPRHRRGDVVLTVAPAMQNQRILLQ